MIQPEHDITRNISTFEYKQVQKWMQDCCDKYNIEYFSVEMLFTKLSHKTYLFKDLTGKVRSSLEVKFDIEDSNITFTVKERTDEVV